MHMSNMNAPAVSGRSTFDSLLLVIFVSCMVASATEILLRRKVGLQKIVYDEARQQIEDSVR